MSINLFVHPILRFAVARGHNPSYHQWLREDGGEDGEDVNVRLHQLC